MRWIMFWAIQVGMMLVCYSGILAFHMVFNYSITGVIPISPNGNVADWIFERFRYAGFFEYTSSTFTD